MSIRERKLFFTSAATIYNRLQFSRLAFLIMSLLRSLLGSLITRRALFSSPRKGVPCTTPVLREVRPRHCAKKYFEKKVAFLPD